MYENNIFCIHQFHNLRLFDNHTLTFNHFIPEIFHFRFKVGFQTLDGL